MAQITNDLTQCITDYATAIKLFDYKNFQIVIAN